MMMMRSGLLGDHKVGEMKSGVSAASSEIVSRVLRLIVLLKYVIPRKFFNVWKQISSQ